MLQAGRSIDWTVVVRDMCFDMAHRRLVERLQRRGSPTKETYLKVGEQVSMTIGTRQNMLYCVRRTRHARVVACLTICLRLLRILIELAGITDASADRGDVRRVNVLFLQPVPGYLCEPGMVHDVLASAVQVAKALGEIRSDELLQQIVRIGVDVGRVFDPRLENVLVDFHRRSAIPKGRKAAEHFEDEDAERPPVAVSTTTPLFGLRPAHQSTDLL